MNYFVRRGAEEFGPYTLGDLQRYVQSGNIAPDDMVRSEDNEFQLRSVREVLGIVPPPAGPGTAVVSPWGGAPGPWAAPAGPAMIGAAPSMANGAPLPPNLHWGLVLLLHFVSCGMFAMIWLLVQAWWIRQLDRSSKAIWYLAAYIGVGYSAMVPYMAFGAVQGDDMDAVAIALLGTVFLISISSAVLYYIGVYSMRGTMIDYFNRHENIGLRLSGVMTFFFALFYFQYHMSRIAQWKKTGVLV